LTKLDYIATCILVCPSAHKTGAPIITQCIAVDGVDGFHRDMMRLNQADQGWLPEGAEENFTATGCCYTVMHT
jgi:hypothetical protein